jgi:molybdate transport system substrate-binding protein
MIQRRGGQVSSLFVAFLASVGVVIALAAWLWLSPGNPDRKVKPLVMYCAVSAKAPVEAIAREYERIFGVRIELQFGASQTLLTNATVSRQGDLYLPADDSYIVFAKKKGLLADEIPVAAQRLVLVVRKGNPKRVLSLEDLLRPEVALAQANPGAAASGKVARDILRKTGQWDAIEKHTIVFTSTVVEAANTVKLNTADAAFVWDAMATQYPELEVVPLAALRGAESKLVVAVLKSSDQPAEALRFARALASGRAFFKSAGFHVDDDGK